MTRENFLKASDLLERIEAIETGLGEASNQRKNILNGLASRDRITTGLILNGFDFSKLYHIAYGVDTVWIDQSLGILDSIINDLTILRDELEAEFSKL